MATLYGGSLLVQAERTVFARECRAKYPIRIRVHRFLPPIASQVQSRNCPDPHEHFSTTNFPDGMGLGVADEMSVLMHFPTWRSYLVMSGRGKAEIICSFRVFRILTQLGHRPLGPVPKNCLRSG